MNDPSLKAAPHPGVNRTQRPLVHYAEKTGSLDQPYWDRLAGKTPRQKHTTAQRVLITLDMQPTLRSESGVPYTLTQAGSVGLRHPQVDNTH